MRIDKFITDQEICRLKELLQEVTDICDWSVESDQYDEDEQKYLADLANRLIKEGIGIDFS